MTSSPIDIVRGGDRGRIAVLRVSGRLDSDTAPQLIEQGAEVQAEGRNLVVNLSGVSFLGSSGVGALLVLVEQFQQQAGAVQFAAMSPSARAVVDLLDLEDYLTVHESEDDAIRALEAA